ncbi:MAG: hypothetical protein KA155_04365 [Alphaproteobacteria bacterium]|jgi:hypothetical protein|nr:hypothetical protein [Alphaproteobacteria bacterium]
MADGNDFLGLGRKLEQLKDSAVDGITRRSQDAAKEKLKGTTGLNEQDLRDAQDPAGAARRKAEEQLRKGQQKAGQAVDQGLGNAQRGVGNKVDETTGKTKQGILGGLGFNGGGSDPNALKKDEEAQRLEEEKRQKTLAEPRGPSELYKKELAEQEALTKKLEAEKEERKKNPPGKSKAELDAEAEQERYMPKARPQSYDGAPSTPSGAIPISYDVGSQAKGDLTDQYGKALGLQGLDAEEVAPLAKPGQPFKI